MDALRDIDERYADYYREFSFFNACLDRPVAKEKIWLSSLLMPVQEMLGHCKTYNRLNYMRQRRPFKVNKKIGSAGDKDRSVKEIVADLRRDMPANSNYRQASLRVHGLICAKCGREFDINNQHLLTVHHKDGNHLNNPPDGSNWENLCTYCHDDEHSRGMLGDYLSPE